MTAGTGTQLRSNGGGQSACMVGKCACSGRVVSIAIAAVLVTVFVARPVIAADAPPGATSCSGCHPAKRWVDTVVPRLVGRNPAEIVAAMQGFKSGALPATVMGRIAKGFSEEEIKAIAAWYGAQKE